MDQDKKYFMLFACCIPVKGASRSIICDLQRGTYKFIPNGLYDILTECRKMSVAAIKEMLDHNYDQTIDEYFDFLIANEFGIWRDKYEDNFREIDLAWKRPELVTNAILDFSKDSDYDYAKVFTQLEELGCKFVQLRFFSDARLSYIEDVLKHTDYSRLRSVELIVKYTEELSDESRLKDLVRKYGRANYIVIHSAPFDHSFQDMGTNIFQYTRQVINSASHCGQISAGYFSVNLETFSLGRHFNTCLTRKISVDTDGNIKNCPSMEASFGNVKESSLHEALLQKDFKQYWDINKDQVETCKDCEFRYICTDCRAFITKPDDLYSKPSKCGYDPYAGVWNKEHAPALSASSESMEIA